MIRSSEFVIFLAFVSKHVTGSEFLYSTCSFCISGN